MFTCTVSSHLYTEKNKNYENLSKNRTIFLEHCSCDKFWLTHCRPSICSLLVPSLTSRGPCSSLPGILVKGPFRVNNSGHAEGQHGGRGWEEGYWGTESGASGGLGSINSCMWAVDWGGGGMNKEGRGKMGYCLLPITVGYGVYN